MYTTLFWTDFIPLPLSHVVTHLGKTPKVSHISRTPIFGSMCTPRAYICLNSRRFFTGGFFWEFCLEILTRGGFCPSPVLSEKIHYNRKLNINFNFRFH